MRAAREHVLSDDTAHLLEFLQRQKPAQTRVVILLDNAGYELVADLALLGLDTALMRYVAIAVSRVDQKRTWGTLQIGLGIPILLSMIASVGVFALAYPVAEHVFHDIALAPLLQELHFLRNYEGVIRVEPLAHFPVERDLVTVIDDFMDKLKRVRPYIIPKQAKAVADGEYLQTPAELKKFKQYSMCINCMLCYAACPEYGPMPLATNINQESISPRTAGVLGGRKRPVFSARYRRMALLSNTVTSPSTIAGTLAFGLIARYSGLC